MGVLKMSTALATAVREQAVKEAAKDKKQRRKYAAKMEAAKAPAAHPAALPVTLEIDAHYLKAALCFAAVKELKRPYLQGVCLNVLSSGAVRLTGTDGRAMGIFNLPLSNLEANPAREDFQTIIPRDIIEALKIRSTDFQHVPVILTVSADRKQLTLARFGQTFTCDAIKDRYPDYLNITNGFKGRTPSGEAAQFDADVLNTMGKAFKILHPKLKYCAPAIAHDGANNSALFSLACENFIGVVMPLKVDAPRGLPDWI
jgi:hypothetical protein